MGYWKNRIALILFALVPLCAGCSRWTVGERLGRNLPDALRGEPQQNRRWQPQLAVLPYAEMTAEGVTIRNVRQCRWKSGTEAVVKHRDWRIRWDDVQTTDFIMVPFPDSPYLAHTMFSFGLTGGRQIVVSVEARLEKGESFGAVAGSVRQFELMYVVADEVDVLGLRAEQRRDDVFLYRTVATPEQSVELLRSMLRRANGLAESPEFYDSVVNNCMTNLVDHLNEVKPGMVSASVVGLLPGTSDAFAYELGLLETDLPFEQARQQAAVSLRVRQYIDDPDFSQKIRR